MSIHGIKQRVANVVFGTAIGDALGICAEFKSSVQVHLRWPYPSGFQNYEEEHRPQMQHHWAKGEYSDDTEQMLCILDTYLSQNDYAADMDPVEFARAIRYWQFSNGKGCGHHTEKVLNHPDFADPMCSDPFRPSRDVWEQTGGYAAPNGAIMRCAANGILRPWDLDWTERNAVICAQVTHWDPRCVASAVALSVAVACLVMGQSVEQALSECSMRASKYDPECVKYILNPGTLEQLKLDEGMDGTGPINIGFTYKCLSAAFWALIDSQTWDPHAPEYLQAHKTITEVLYAAGDTDTNGAVAGGLLGARMSPTHGWSKHLVSGLVEGVALQERVDKLVARYPVGMVE